MIKLLYKLYQERQKTQKEESQSKQEKEATQATYRRLFNTIDGKYVLEHLVKTNLIGSIAERGDDMLTIGVKQGRANLVDEIFQRVNKG